MSARLTLHALLCSGEQEDCSMVDTAYKAVKREVLREAAAKQRAALERNPGLFEAELIDLIDPDGGPG